MAEPQSCLADKDFLPSSVSTMNSCSGNNVDRVLFKNLVEIVPLVESLMDKRATSSFSRRASIVHTAAPPPKKKSTDHRGKKGAQTNSIKTLRDVEENAQNNLNELMLLQDQVAQLQKKLLEKEEALKSAESLANQVNETYASVNDLKRQVSEKDVLIKSTTAQLYNAKVNLADKQAALERLEWESKMSKKKVEELQGNALSNDLEISALMQLFDTIGNGDSFPCPDYTFFEPIPPPDEIKVTNMVKMEEARTEYLSAVAAAKENPSDESLTAAAEARKRLQSFVF